MKISVLDRREVQLPKEGWLERQFTLARNELAQRPELRIRASQFAGERQQRAHESAERPISGQEVMPPIFPNSTERN